jgi:hypothetical protein
MPQRPKVFRIARIHIQVAGRPAPVRTGPKTAAPAKFTAWAELRTPDVLVALTIVLEMGAVPVIEELVIQPGPKKTPVTGTVLRGILLDQIVPAAIAAAGEPVTGRPDIAPGAYQFDGMPDEGQAWVSAAPGADERVQRVAQIYREALSAGSRAPAAAAAEEMKLSRAQIARYVRRAREAGLIPPVDEVIKGRPAAPASPVLDPGPEHPEVHMRRLTDPSLW